ncbi:hypothetical protein [Acetobacter pasteurianus]|uniref:hypothetical protein n=1 Tax=Acetobacter TaxID=434 RepID=UPI000AF2EED7|nr:hypothetical protein [Acetobacter pasteurianus]
MDNHPAFRIIILGNGQSHVANHDGPIEKALLAAKHIRSNENFKYWATNYEIEGYKTHKTIETGLVD